MIVRIWTTGLVAGCRATYQAFAESVSLPMFRRQSGLRGVHVLVQAGQSQVLTYWDDAPSITRMEQSADYQATVAQLGQAQVLQGPQRVELFDCALGFFIPDAP
ncbi:MAG: hypothetical protein H7Z21_15685 [Hymenobacter sp.]|nr:hypothetical protein [Hymenobacter sp.]